jgi:hypothetical protein
VHAHLARAADLLKVVGKCVVDLGHEGVEPRLPPVADLLDTLVELVGLALVPVHAAAELLDVAGALLVVANDVRVRLVNELQLCLLRGNLLVEISRCTVPGHLREVFLAAFVLVADFDNLVLGRLGVGLLLSAEFCELFDLDLFLLDLTHDVNVPLLEPAQV